MNDLDENNKKEARKSNSSASKETKKYNPGEHGSPTIKTKSSKSKIKKLKNSEVFDYWHVKDSLSRFIAKEDAAGCYLEKIETALYVAKGRTGKALCFFEVAQDSGQGFAGNDGHLFTSLPSKSPLQLPVYLVLYKVQERIRNQAIRSLFVKDIENFRIKRLYPREELIGTIAPRQFAGLLSSVVNLCQKREQEE